MSDTRLHSLSFGAFQNKGRVKTASTFNATSLLWAGCVLVILLGAFSLNLWRLDAESIWHDEGWSIRAMRGPFTTPDDNTPYLYYTYLHLLWRLGVGETPFAMRYGSVLLGLLTTAVTMRVAGQWFGRPASLTGGILVAVSPLLWEYAQEIRAYVAVPLVGLVLLWVVDRVLKYQPTQSIPISIWLTVWLAEIVGLYTHNLVVPLVIWLNVAVGVVWLWRRDWRHMVTWAGLQSVLILAYIPWLLTQAPSGTPLNSPPEIGFALVRDIWHSYFLPSLPQLRGATNTTWLDIAGLMAMGLGGAWIVLQRTHRAWLLISQALLVPLFSTALILRAHIDFHPRYYIAVIPAALLIMVAGVKSLGKIHPQFATAGYGLLVVGFLAITQTNLRDIAATRTFQHDDYAGLAHYYATLPDDAVILIPYKREAALQDYYAQKFDIRAKFINIPLYSDADTVIRRLNELATDRHVEFLTWFQLPADVRGMYPCLLTVASNEIFAPQTFFGLETSGYQLTTPLEFSALDATPHYQEMDLRQTRFVTSPRGTCVETTWGLSQPTTADWQVAMQLHNPLGVVLDTADAPITRRDQTPTSEWSNNEIGAAYHLLQLPEMAPLENYPISLTVYADNNLSGLDVLSDSGSPIGKSYTLSETVPTEGLSNENAAQTTRVLTANATADGVVESNQPFEVTLVLADNPAPLPKQVPIELRGDGWALQQTIAYPGHPVLAWLRFDFPAEATSGAVSLWVGDVEIAHYTLQVTTHDFEAPPFSIEVGTEIPNIGTLIGVTATRTVFSTATPPQITLIWQATHTTATAYTVFVQLLDPNGVLLAQSDSIPAENTRPTTGWVTGEYISDNHTLNFRVDEYVENYTGPAYFIVGLYNPATFERVTLADGQNFIRLPLEITIIRE
ncbi:MAG: hypothetical protein HY862_03045 [Chloroflexi bacterium]|nr:hypothetical protein [Chloroflexota bacterium]